MIDEIEWAEENVEDEEGDVVGATRHQRDLNSKLYYKIIYKTKSSVY